MPVLAPSPSSRIHMLDVIQGLGLLGILLVNSQMYSLYGWLNPNQVYHAHLDKAETYMPVRFFIHFLVQGPVYPLGSFLFGLTFYHCWHKLRQQRANVNRLIFRGLCVLFVFGLIHSLVFWFNDLLHQYALLGFTLLYFVKQSTQKVLLWAGALLGIMIVVAAFERTPFFANTYPFINDFAGSDQVRLVVIKIWQQGSFIEVIQQQAVLFQLRYLGIFAQNMIPLLHQLLLLLLGLAAGKSGFLERLDQYRLQLSLLLLVVLPFAILLNGLNTLLALGMFSWPVNFPADNALVITLTSVLGTPLLAMIYVFEISLDTRKYIKRWAIWVGQAGQMGLTNYLLQTLLCMICFYGYGMGLGGRLTLLESLIVVVLIYAIQLIFSHLWMRRHELGPVEWLWVKLVYGKPASLVNGALHSVTENEQTLP